MALAFVCFSFVCQIKLITFSFSVHVKLFQRIVPCPRDWRTITDKFLSWRHTLEKLVPETCTCVSQSSTSFFLVQVSRAQLSTAPFHHRNCLARDTKPCNVIGRTVVLVQETVTNLRQIFDASFWYKFLEHMSPALETAGRKTSSMQSAANVKPEATLVEVIEMKLAQIVDAGDVSTTEVLLELMPRHRHHLAGDVLVKNLDKVLHLVSVKLQLPQLMRMGAATNNTLRCHTHQPPCSFWRDRVTIPPASPGVGQGNSL